MADTCPSAVAMIMEMYLAEGDSGAFSFTTKLQGPVSYGSYSTLHGGRLIDPK